MMAKCVICNAVYKVHKKMKKFYIFFFNRATEDLSVQ